MHSLPTPEAQAQRDEMRSVRSQAKQQLPLMKVSSKVINDIAFKRSTSPNLLQNFSKTQHFGAIQPRMLNCDVCNLWRSS